MFYQFLMKVKAAPNGRLDRCRDQSGRLSELGLENRGGEGFGRRGFRRSCRCERLRLVRVRVGVGDAHGGSLWRLYDRLL